MGIFSTLKFFYSRKIYPGFSVSKNALVVDIGSGDKPLWRADVYVDKLSLGNVQRASEFRTIHDIGLFFNCDVQKLPFKDKSFDFSFCSHLLEHVTDPEKAINEIVRISKRGYLEVPNGILETIKPFDSHLWMIFQDKNTLVFIRKSKRIHEILSSNGKKYSGVLDKIPEPFIRLYWDKNISYKIIDSLTEAEKFRSKVGDKKKDEIKHINYYLILIKIFRAAFHKEKNISEIKKLVLSE